MIIYLYIAVWYKCKLSMERIWLGEIYICVNDLFDAPIQRVTLYTLCISGTNFFNWRGETRRRFYVSGKRNVPQLTGSSKSKCSVNCDLVSFWLSIVCECNSSLTFCAPFKEGSVFALLAFVCNYNLLLHFPVRVYVHRLVNFNMVFQIDWYTQVSV